jgi:Spy/CpxP family protein refolding chaperone
MRWWGVVAALLISVGQGAEAWAQQPAPQPGVQPGPGMGMGSGGMMGGMGMGQGQPGMQGMPGMMMGQGGSGMMGAMETREGSRYDRPVISILLRQHEMFRLTSEQEQKLRALRAEYEKDAARGGGEVRAAEVDLRELLVPDAPDLSKVEAQVKKIAALQGDLRFRRIQTVQAAFALLTKEQRQQLDRHLDQMGMMGMMGGGMGPRPSVPEHGGSGTEHRH